MALIRTMTVIVTRCYKYSEKDDTSWRTYGDREVDHQTTDPVEAVLLANSKIAKGKCVILRPNYNEPELGKGDFREWRSFSGEPLREVWF